MRSPCFITNVRIVNPRYLDNDPTMRIFASNNGMTFDNLVSDTYVQIQGTDIRVKDARTKIIADTLNPLINRNGILLSPVRPDPTKFDDVTAKGNWREPLLVDISTDANHHYQPTGTAPVPRPLSIQGTTTSDNLTTWKTSNGTPAFVLLPDGNIGTVKTDTDPVVGTPHGKLAIYHATGSLVGYVVVYNPKEPP